MSKDRTSEYSAVILVGQNGQLLLQLRDNDPAVIDPNKLSLFAGKLRAGETALDGARRELREETTLTPDQLNFLFTFQAVTSRHGHSGKCHVFVSENIDPSKLKILEGQGYRTINNASDLEKFDFSQISKDILIQYFEFVK
jgi:8-oxo-dGTP pyrophosphatase MutT (NUDIX family)